MFATLVEVIDGLEIPADGMAIAEALALRDRLDARIAAAIGAFDRAGLWDVDGATSMTAWLRSTAGMTSRSAKRLASLSSRLRSLPATSAAYADGSLSSGQVAAITAGLDDDTIEVFAAYEAELVPYLMPLTVPGVSRAMAAWRSRVEADGDEPREPERALHLSQTLDDRYVLDGSFDAEGGSVVATAVRLALTEDTDVQRTPATRRADALIEVCRFFLDHQRSHPGGRHRPHVNVVVELDAIEERRGGRVIGGPNLDGPTVSRLLCDCSVHRVLTAGRSAVLDYGTSTRTIAAPLWSALVIRGRALPLPRMRPAVDLVRGAPRGLGDRGWAHRSQQPRPALHPAPPPPASAGLARQAPTRRHVRGHRSERQGARDRPAARLTTLVSPGGPANR